MTLCQKLEELGFICDNPWFKYFKYYYDINISVCIWLSSTGYGIADYGVCDCDGMCLYKQEDLDNMQVAFNRLKRDIKEIEKWQKQTIKLTK